MSKIQTISGNGCLKHNLYDVEKVPMLPTLPDQRAHNAFDDNRTHDHTLLDRIKNCDETALQEFIDLYGAWLHRLVSRLLAFDADAEDVVQMIFVTVWRKACTFRGDSSLKTWLYRITVRHCQNHQRAIARWKRHIEKLWERGRQENRGTVQDARWERVQGAISELKHADREILVLVYFEGHSMSELSKLLEQKINTLEVRLHRARERLKTILNQTDTTQ